MKKLGRYDYSRLVADSIPTQNYQDFDNCEVKHSSCLVKDTIISSINKIIINMIKTLSIIKVHLTCEIGSLQYDVEIGRH